MFYSSILSTIVVFLFSTANPILATPIYSLKKLFNSTTQTLDSYKPQINNFGQIAWAQINDYGISQFGNEIYYYNGNSVIRITNNNYCDWYPKITNDSEIYWYAYENPANPDGLGGPKTYYRYFQGSITSSDELTYESISFSLNTNTSGQKVYVESFILRFIDSDKSQYNLVDLLLEPYDKFIFPQDPVINDSGQIAFVAEDYPQTIRLNLYLATPIPIQPIPLSSSLLLFGSGLLGLTGCRWFRKS